MFLADKEVLVNNRGNKEWHAKTSSKIKTFRLMANCYHELTKEPDNHKMFDACLKFMGDRLVGQTSADNPGKTPFGVFDHTKVKYYKARPLLRRKKFWVLLLILAYLAVGILFAIGRRKKRFLFTWPKMLRR